tara:strand:- start:226 stop:519 length:294 start_codon:yes stop_codon:yes gene_type:complete
MDFLEDLELYNTAMENAYDFITGKKDIEKLTRAMDLYEIEEYPLPFDPIYHDGRSHDIIDMVIEHFSELEAYEKCAELLEIKENLCSDTQTDSDQLL